MSVAEESVLSVVSHIRGIPSPVCRQKTRMDVVRCLDDIIGDAPQAVSEDDALSRLIAIMYDVDILWRA